MTPKVSIIVPCYGVEKYLDRCMESLVNQTLRDIEIILVDDVSPDRVPEMCDDWEKKDNRIKVIHKEKNGGLGYARNTGLEAASGEYVAFVDSDDHVALDMYESLYNKAVQTNTDVVFGSIYMEDSAGTWHKIHEFEDKSYLQGDAVKAFMLDMVANMPFSKKERVCEMCVWRSIYRRNIIKAYDIKFESEREVVSEDIPFNVDFLKNASSVSFIDKGCYYYHNNGVSLTSNVNPEKLKGYKNLRYVLQQKLKDADPEMLRSNRFYIGYIRMFILQLANTRRKDKSEVIKSIINDPIWNDIKPAYKKEWLPVYPRTIYWLIINKHSKLLLFVSWFFMEIKKNSGKRL